MKGTKTGTRPKLAGLVLRYIELANCIEQEANSKLS
jgi:hypothetical protein